MKNIYIKRITALALCAAMIGSMPSVSASSFVDPADVYAEFTGTSKFSDEDSTVTEMPPDNEIPVSETAAPVNVNDTSQTSELAALEEDAPVETKETSVTGKRYVAPSPEDVTIPVTSISIYSFRTTAEVGETFKVGYKIGPAGTDDIISFSSSNPAVASIDEYGNVKALSEGNAVITVSSSKGEKDRFNISVKAAAAAVPEDTDDAPPTPETNTSEATDIDLKRMSVTVNQGDTYTIQYELTPKNSTDTVSFRSLNKAVASVDKNGVVTAQGPGNTRIICKTGSGASVRLNITVIEVMTDEQVDQKIEEEIEKEYDDSGALVPSEVRFTEESAGLQVGESISLSARVYPAGSTYTYEFTSDNPEVAAVSSKGRVTAVSPGNAVITLTTDNGKSDSVYITVYGNVIKGIDVSKWNGDINWKTVKKSGMANFAMIRASYGYEDTDPMLDQNVRGCEENGIPYGFYHYMYAHNTSDAKKEAAYFLNVIQNYSPEYPVVLDIEEEFYKQMPKKEVTAIVTTFMETLENAGYYAMIYSYAKFFDDCLIMDKIEKYDIWVACWGDEQKLAENYSYHYGMWQYSESGTLSGIDEYVDLNYSYKDYKGIIAQYGLNKPTLW